MNMENSNPCTVRVCTHYENGLTKHVHAILELQVSNLLCLTGHVICDGRIRHCGYCCQSVIWWGWNNFDFFVFIYCLNLLEASLHQVFWEQVSVKKRESYIMLKLLTWSVWMLSTEATLSNTEMVCDTLPWLESWESRLVPAAPEAPLLSPQPVWHALPTYAENEYIIECHKCTKQISNLPR